MTEKKPSHGNDRESVQAERDRLQAIIDSIDDGIYIVGRDYRIRFMNRRLQSEVGDGAHRLCYEFFGHSPEECEFCQCGLGSFGPEYRREWHSEFTQKTYDMIVSPVHLPDGEIARLHILRDITEKKRLMAQLEEYSHDLEAKVAEQAERLRRQERLALLGEISAGLAHQIRTPLGSIITGVKLLENERQNPEERELVLDLLKKEATRMEQKVSEFLSYARPRWPQCRETQVQQLLEEVRAVLAVDPEKLGQVSIEIEMEENLPPWPMDPEQMKEVLLNLGANALEALEGEGRLILRAGRAGRTLEMRVEDTGPGIPSDALSEIFKPFYTRAPGGTGLGLSICQQIVESHGGTIHASSSPGSPTTFTVRLPKSDG